MTDNLSKHAIELLAQEVVKYIRESDMDIDDIDDGDYSECLNDYLESENPNLPDHESSMDFLNETIESLLDD